VTSFVTLHSDPEINGTDNNDDYSHLLSYSHILERATTLKVFLVSSRLTRPAALVYAAYHVMTALVNVAGVEEMKPWIDEK
jgi:hypothetical protein